MVPRPPREGIVVFFPLSSLLVALLALQLAAPAGAAGEDVPTTIIVSPDLECRILLPLERVTSATWYDEDLGVPSLESTAGLTDAELILDLDDQLVLQDLEIEAFLVVSPWNADSVSWKEPWEIPGGDLWLSLKREDEDRHLAAIDELEFGELREELRFDLRKAVQVAWDEGYTVYGFALSMPWEVGDGFSPSELGILGKIGEAQLDLQFEGGPWRAGSAHFHGTGSVGEPAHFDAGSPSGGPPVTGPPSDQKVKSGHVPTKPPVEYVKKPVAPPPPPPPPAKSPDGEKPVEERENPPPPVEKSGKSQGAKEPRPVPPEAVPAEEEARAR